MGKKRSGYNITLNRPQEFVELVMGDYLKKHEFVRKEVKGEIVWQQGSGWITAPKMLKYSYNNGVLNMEVWLLVSLLPGVYCGEMNLDGAYGFAVKDAYKKDINSLIMILKQDLPDGQMATEQYSNGESVNSSTYSGPVEVQGFDNSKYAKSGFIISIICFILALLSVCIIIAIGYGFASLLLMFGAAIGISNSRKGLSSSKKGLAVSGIVLGIISVVISAIMFILILISKFMY